MLAKTAIGKRSAEDAANYWTIIIDAENFAGPVVYVSTWFWDHRTNWNPSSVSWSDPRSLIGLIQEGWEGAVGAKKINDERTGDVWYRLHKLQFPQDRNTDGIPSFTSFTGHSEYLTSAIYDATEQILQGNKGASDVKTAAMDERSQPRCRTLSMVCIGVTGCAQKHDCNAFLYENGGVNEASCVAAGGRWVTNGHLGMWTERVGEIWFDGFGVGPGTDEGDDDASCAVRMLLDINGGKLDCEDGWCTVPYFLKAAADGTTSAFAEAEAPQTIRDAFEATPFTPRGQTYGATEHGRSRSTRYGPPDEEAQQPCFDKPGPASDDLYCTRLEV
jgi:hypothetical protein